MFKPDKSWKVDCYVDSEFAGLYKAEHDQDPVSAKSRTGYFIKFCNFPILWVSKMQTQIAFSTMEAEYIALSQSMRDLIPILEILKELLPLVLKHDHTPVCSSYSKAFQDGNPSAEEFLPQSSVYEDNQTCYQTYFCTISLVPF
jgi:hypothetical protein